jgi:D-cysteine desulfhydrase
VKQEGDCAPRFGGAQVRKLELLLGAARRAGRGDVVAVGPVGDEALLAMAACARQAGMRPYIIATPSPDSAQARQTARLLDAWTEGWFVARRPAAVGIAALRAFLALRIVARVRPVLLPHGATDARSVVGWVSGGLELAHQLDAVGPVDVVYVPVVTGGVAAGILLGLRLAGLESEVVLVGRDRSRRVRRLARAAERQLRAAGAGFGTIGLGRLRAAAPVTAPEPFGVTRSGNGALGVWARERPGRAVVVDTGNRVDVQAELGAALAVVPRRLELLLKH